MIKRNLYLHIQDKETALNHFLEAFDFLTPEKEVIPTVESRNRITYEAVFARYSSPSYNSCAMDGIAVISAHTHGASETTPLLLEYETDYLDVDTGDMIAPPYDAVIMAEELIETDQGYKIIAPASPFAHVRAIGEDIVAKEMVLPCRHKIRPVDIPVLLASGIRELAVMRKPVATVIPTGDEMMEYSQEPEDGKITETNSWMFENLIHEHGGICRRYPIVADDLDAIKKVLSEAAEQCDIVMINAGSSAGREDYTIHAIRELGEVWTHGVAIKPGKPVILGKIHEKPVLGLPGYPVSAYLTFMEFAVPLLGLYYRSERREPTLVKARLTKTLMSGLKYEEYVRVKLGMVDQELIASPLDRGAGASLSLVKADGFCIIPRNREGLMAHEEVMVRLLKSPEQIAQTLLSVGSHDLILDVLEDVLMEGQSGVHLASSHVGSLAGLIALKKRETHLAPTHLLEEETGTYNVEIIKEMFPDRKMVLIKGVRRRQGLIVPKGNPLSIRGIADLTKGMRYINRQKGAGTRVLLDYQLKKMGIAPEEINGYDHEVTTHMSVAVAVQKHNADVGMGIYTSAMALDLDFIDIAYEEYDFATYEEFLELPKMKVFLEVLRSPAFAQRLEALGGYGYDEIGEMVYVE